MADDIEQDADAAIAEGKRAEARLLRRGDWIGALWMLGRTRGVELALDAYRPVRRELERAVAYCRKRARRHE